MRFPALSALTGNQPPWIMGILNVTPDSFSDGGLSFTPSAALKKLADHAAAGASIIDVGGESTRPGATPVPVEEEIRRVEPVVAGAAERHILSVDTFKAPVARRCLELGARIINDISALRADPEMRSVIAEHKAFVVMMFSKESAEHPHASESKRDFKDVVCEISEFLEQRVEYALAGGIPEDRIILDPGLSKFVSHDPRYSWELIGRFTEFSTRFKFPLLISASRKGFLGGTLEDRDSLSQYAAMVALVRGAVISRTHNVAMACEFMRAAREMKILPDDREAR